MKSKYWGLFFIVLGLGSKSLSMAIAAPLESGIREYDQENYEEALVILKQLYDQQHHSASKRYLGLTYYQLENYVAARPLLEEVASTSNDPDVSYALVEVLLGLNQVNSAKTELDKLLKMTASSATNNAEVYHLAGKVYLAQNNPDAALAAFETALNQGDEYLKQQVVIDLLPIYIDRGLLSEAKRAVEESTAALPDSFEAEFLRGLLTQLNQVDKPFSLKLGYRIDSDSNVALSPGRGVVADISEASDIRHVLTADMTGSHELGGGKRLFAEAHLYQSLHHDLDHFNETRQNYLMGFGWSGSRWGFRLPYELNWNLLDGDKFLVSQSIIPGIYYRINPQHILYGFGRYQNNDFDEVLSSPAEDRNGTAISFGGMWLWQFSKDGNMRTIVEHVKDDADGNNWEREETRLYAFLEYRFSPDIKLGIGYQRDDHNYDNLHDVFLVERDDNADLLFGNIIYTVNKHWEVQVQASNVKWKSNIDIYSYDRNVFSIGVTWLY